LGAFWWVQQATLYFWQRHFFLCQKTGHII
jgi:hypothetical protein